MFVCTLIKFVALFSSAVPYTIYGLAVNKQRIGKFLYHLITALAHSGI